MNQLLDDIGEAMQMACPSGPGFTNECCGYSANVLQQNAMILDVEALHRGTVYKASYFVEHGVIHAKIGHGVRQIPLNNRDAAATVLSHLTGFLQQTDRKRELIRIWSNVFEPPSR